MPSLRALAALGVIALFGCAANDPAPASQNDPYYGQNTRFSWAGELTQGGFIQGVAPDGAMSVTVGGTPVELSPDGRFFAAFDRDAPATVTLAARLDSGQLHGETLTIIPRQWLIEHVKIAKRSSSSDEEYWAIREPEYNAINAARAQKTGASGWRQRFVWPVKGRISGRFGRQRIYNGVPAAFHTGIDIAPGNGVPFVAPADGTVVLARTGFSLEGGLIIIDHGGGLNSAFLHASKIVVREGERVAQGQHIGNVGATGRATGPHLHWSLKWGEARLDPLLFTGPMS